MDTVAFTGDNQIFELIRKVGQCCFLQDAYDSTQRGSNQHHSLSPLQLSYNFQMQLEQEKAQKEEEREKWKETIKGNCARASSHSVNIQSGFGICVSIYTLYCILYYIREKQVIKVMTNI